jgi:dynein heavy chain
MHTLTHTLTHTCTLTHTHKQTQTHQIWIVLDGPIDAVWIENLNSVLDDNKLLTLANGDRIPMSPDAKLVFEPHNVDNASPATVSRNGMVFMSSSALDWVPILDSWLKTRPPAEKTPLREAFHASYEGIQTHGRFTLKPKMKLLECNYIKQACDLLTGLIPHKDDGTAVGPHHLRRLYVFAVMWSIGAVLELSDRERLQEYMLSSASSADCPTPGGPGAYCVPFARQSLLVVVVQFWLSWW